MMRTHESPMDFQYDNPIKPDPSSPFSLAHFGKSLGIDKTKTSTLKRDWQESPTKSFSFSTPLQGNGNGNGQVRSVFGFQPRINAALQQDTPGTDATDDATSENAPSEQDSPIPQAARATKRNKLSDLAKLKMKRRRQKHLRDAQLDQSSDEEFDPFESHAEKSSTGKGQQALGSWNLDQHRDLPYIASGYLQLFFNLSLLSIMLYFLVSFIMTIQADVNKKVEEYSAEILSEISVCSKEYLENRCSPDQRVPAMQMACQAWERCMERDPAKVGRARVSAETFAEIVNSLIEPISYKTMVFCLVLVFGSVFVSNFAFGLLRQKSYRDPLASKNHGAGMQPATFMIQATPQQQPQHPGGRSQKQVRW